MELHRALGRLPINSRHSFRPTELQRAADAMQVGLDAIADVQRALAGFAGDRLPS